MTVVTRALVMLLGVISFSTWLPAAEALPKAYRVYVGTYTTYGAKESKGIYLFEFDPATGKAGEPRLVAEGANPSFMAFGPGSKNLYVVNEVAAIGPAPQQQGTASLTAYRVDQKTGELKLLNSVPTQGTITCHVSVDREGEHALVASYGKGKSAVCFDLNADGSIGKATSSVQHSGKSANPKRQESPHAHSVNLSPDGRFAFVADLGTDRLKVYPFDQKTGKLDGEHAQTVTAKPGAGPRHFAFHPNGKFAYNNNELDWTVTAFSYDAATGKLNPLQTITTIPADYTGTGGTAEVVVHPSGKFLYVSNRGPDSLAIYQIGENGKLTAVGFTSTNGKIPRNFSIDPTGQFLMAANQDSDTVVVFKIDQTTGGLTPTGEVIRVPMPVCVKWLRVEG
ncbi:lactonase family protein [Planctomicrobium piriforme]|uniref:6-phosphogluconolactonase n=1 Tax=Planctomicrobium piriforme TaxID=1576369 RepID=A0A1I3NQB5_9PLAN|nr:lactonase family protein [Planctomicrobium piriforme]SFJ11508.1 6-phosphogluconolactonase [Planctomicrobium piriforme]